MMIKLSLWPLAPCRSKLSQAIPSLTPMSISGCDISFSQSVKNFGFYLHETLSMDAHTEYLCRILLCQLRRIKSNDLFMRHKSSLVCMVGIIYVCIDTIFAFDWYILFFSLFNTNLYCLVECLSMIVWTPAVLGVL